MWKIGIIQQNRLRNQRRNEYYKAINEQNAKLIDIKRKRSIISAENDALEKLLIETNDKYDNILEENSNLIQDLNKTKINNDICSSFNKIKLIAIKKIYS